MAPHNEAPRRGGRSVAWRGGNPEKRRRATRGAIGALGLLALAAAGSAHADLSANDSPMATYIVTSNGAGIAGTRTGLHNGKLKAQLPLVDGVVADLTATDAAALAAEGVNVIADQPVKMLGASDLVSRPPAAVFPQLTGADKLAATGITGKGVTVAVVDTGIAPLADFAGRLTAGPDLSGEGNSLKDSYGHGTFVAGIIAGNGATDPAYIGEAPGASLLSIKVAGATGATTMSTVIQGIQWAVSNQAAYGVKVMNLSLGTPPPSSTATNPLDQAVEKAWAAGITVVTSAGNFGPWNGTITSPGDDPVVITAGSLDDLGTASASDDVMTTFSSVGPTLQDGWFKPDLVTSGRSVVSLMAPDSTIALAYPTGAVGSGNFRGSGTSFSAAITSGAAALVTQANPYDTPNDIKGRLMAYASKGPVGNPMVDGHGSVDAYGAATGKKLSIKQAFGATAKRAADGSVLISDSWNGSSWNGSSWNGGVFNGSSWNGSSWNGSSWNGSSWNGSSWNGSSWNGSSWNSQFWTGSSWNGSSWNGSSWNGSSWNGSSWNGSSWNGSSWNGSSWNGSSWNGSSWNGTSWN